MIRINLLPFREKERVENIRRQVTIAVLSVIFAAVAMAYYYINLINKIDDLTAKTEATKRDLAAAEKQAKKVDQIKKELNRLNQKINVIKDIETNRKASVSLLDNMTQMIIERPSIAESEGSADENVKKVKRLWFTSFQANGNKINIKGIALDNKTVADFMTRLEDSKLYNNITLMTLNQKEINKLNLKSFEITCEKGPAEKAKPAAGKAKT